MNLDTFRPGSEFFDAGISASWHRLLRRTTFNGITSGIFLNCHKNYQGSRIRPIAATFNCSTVIFLLP